MSKESCLYSFFESWKLKVEINIVNETIECIYKTMEWYKV